METTIDSVIIDINTSADNASKGLKNLVATLNSLNGKLKPAISNLSKFKTNLNSAGNSINKFNSKASKTKGVNNFTNVLSKLAKVSILSIGIRQLTNTISSAIDTSNEYIENLNLFYVSMGENAEKAKEFTDNFSEALGVDPSNAMRYMGIFNTLAEGFGISSEKAYVMSKNLTQLSYDMSSFLNIPIEQAMQKIKSGFSGEIEPMRAVGVALDQATLQETAFTLGIKKNISEMTRAQKTQLLYYQMMKKTTTMQGDMARTLLQPANAIRVLKQQFTLLARAIGNVFIPILTAAIPYIMLLTKWLTALAQSIAHVFGFELPTIDTSNLGDVSAGIGDIEDSASGATKELKKMLAPFDELNSIDFGDDKSGSGAGGGISGGELDIPLPEYDALSGALSQNLEKIEDKLKGILPLIGLIASGVAALKLLGLVNNLSKLGTELGVSAGILTGLSKVATGLVGIIAGLAGAIAGFSLGSFIDWITNGNQQLEEIIKTVSIFASAIAGIALIATGNVIPGLALLGGAIGLTIQDFTNANNEVDIFRGKSQELKTALEPTITALQTTQSTIASINFSGLSPSAEEIALLKANFDTVIGKYKETYLAQYEAAKGAVMAREDLTEQEKINQIAALDEFYGQKTKTVEDAENKVNEIIKQIQEQGGNATKEQAQEIANIIETLGKETVDITATSSQEANEIWSRYETSKANITKEKVGEILTSSAELRDKTIQTAEEQYVKTVAAWRNMYEHGTEEQKRYAKNAMANAEKLKNDTIMNAEEQHKDLVFEIGEQNREILENFDLYSGKQLNIFQKTGKGYEVLFQLMSNESGKSFKEIAEGTSQATKFTEDYTSKVSELTQKNMELADTMYETSDEYNELKTQMDNATSACRDITNNVDKATTAGNNMYYAYRNVNQQLNSLASKTYTIRVSSSSTGIQQYATGGFPTTGEAFIARENGPELVGRIGKKSAVANNDQIIEGIRQGVAQGVSEAMPSQQKGPTNVYIGNKKVYSGYGEYANTENNMYGSNIIRV